MFPLELPPFTWLVLATFPLELPFTWLVLATFPLELPFTCLVLSTFPLALLFTWLVLATFPLELPFPWLVFVSLPLELPPFTWLVFATFPLELPFTWLVLARFRACKSELSVSAGTLLAHRASAKNASTLIANLYCFMILSLFHGSSNHSSPACRDLCPGGSVDIVRCLAYYLPPFSF